ncbi:MAG: RNA polymerase factor sigma-54 [Candidatus Omnitrophica bacterium]|nr:RNA polymerase factor sigma-54 [Candidatus Omnitrophota bacterium]
MELKLKPQLHKLLAPQLQQSLKILAMSQQDLENLINYELLSNPVLEETSCLTLSYKKVNQTKPGTSPTADSLTSVDDNSASLLVSSDNYFNNVNIDGFSLKENKSSFIQSLIASKMSLQDHLLRQLGMCCDDRGIWIGQEIIGNIDDNGYLRDSLQEIARRLAVPIKEAEEVLSLIQQFDPPGVGARDLKECLLIQLRLNGYNNSLVEEIVKLHLDDLAKKNYSKIAKVLKQPLEKVKDAVRIITKLNPKPGRNYSLETAYQIIPDVLIEEDQEGHLHITINNERIPRLTINNTYRQLLKNENLDTKTRLFLMEKLRSGYYLLRSIAKRESTLLRVVKLVANIQEEALRNDISLMKPLTYRQIAEKLNIHETTVCRVVMNKFIQTPHHGIIALKEFFPSKIQMPIKEGKNISSTTIKSIINELIQQEDKKKPLSDEDIVSFIKINYSWDVSRRTITKYRQEIGIFSSVYRRER